MTPDQQAAYDAYQNRIKSEKQQVVETPKQRTRSILQGLTFGGADELEAFFRSLGSEDYETAVNEIRGGLAAYKEAEPGAALAYEIGGAAAPAIIASLFSGGSLHWFPLQKL